MTKQIVYLNLPTREPAPMATKASPALFTGQRYQLDGDNLPTDLHGVCAGFECTPDRGMLLPLDSNSVETPCYFWDIDGVPEILNTSLISSKNEHITIGRHTNLLANRFILSHAKLTEPVIHCSGDTSQISVSAEFEFIYYADCMPARLGVLHLLEPNCFVVLKNGERHDLLASEEDQRLLYLDNTNYSNEVIEAVSPILDTDITDTVIQQHYKQSITHVIPEQINELDVESMTILEQYTSFFMQREIPFAQENIWTPVCAPVTWGWSIRISRRHDGAWCLSRKKLLMPAVGHNGQEMPAWQGNTLNKTAES